MIKFKKFNDLSNIDSYLSKFFATVPFGRYITDTTIIRNDAIEEELFILHEYSKSSEIYLAFKGEKILGIIGYKKSKWDSKHFGFNVAKINYFLVDDNDLEKKLIASKLLNYFNDWGFKHEIKLVLAKLDTSNFPPVLAAQNSGFVLYECITQRILHNLCDFNENIFSHKYRYAKKEDLVALRYIAAKNTFNKSHFYLDEQIDSKKIDSLYEKWVDNAYESKSKIIVIEENGIIAGMFIYQVNEPNIALKTISATWQFAAVAPEFRNRGFGKKLFQCALNACIKEGALSVDTTLVEKNIISQKIHEKLGFGLLNTYYTLHKWF